MIIEMSKDGAQDIIFLQTTAMPRLTELQRETLDDIGERLRASAKIMPGNDMGGGSETWRATLSASTTEFRHTEIVSIIRDHGLDVAIK